MAAVETTWKAPGVAEAEARERALREEVYLNAPQTVCGCLVRPITPRLLNILTVVGSPFVCGGHVTEAELLRFLWILSIDFMPGDKAMTTFAKRLGKRMRKQGWDWEYVADEIAQFIDDTFLDAPSGVEATSYYSTTAWLEVKMRKLMGWDVERTLDTPLRRIYQLIRVEQQMNGDNALVNRLSDKIYDEWMKEAAKNPQMIIDAQKQAVGRN